MIKNNSLENRLEKAIKKPVISQKNISEIVSILCSSKNYRLFFEKIRQSNIHKRLFFLHRRDLFGMDETIQLPCFCLTNITNPLKTEIQESRVLKYVISDEVDIVHDAKGFLLSYLDIPEDVASEIEDNFKDIFAYFTILFIRSNKNLRDLVNKKTFNYKIMKSILKDYKNTIDIELIQKEVAAIIEGEKGKIDHDIRIKIENILLRIINLITQNTMATLELPQKAMPNLMLALHLPCKMWLVNILSRTNMIMEDYVNILDDLYINRLISNKSTVFWCENCGLEKPFYSSQYGDIAPSKIRKNKCPNCGKNQSYSSFFILDEILKDAILSKDGFLAVYLCWLLNREQIPYKVNVLTSDTENDFIINNNVLLECKMFKQNKDEMAIESELESSLVQIKKHISSLNKDKQQIKYAYLLWNRYNISKKIVDSLRSKFRNLFREYKLKIFSPETIEELIAQLK